MDFIFHKKLTYKTLRSLVGFFCLLLTNSIFAQKSYYLATKLSSEDSIAATQIDFISHIFVDSISLKTALNAWQQAAFAKSFFEASIDKLERKDSFFTATLHIGSAYKWLNLNAGNVSEKLLEKIGFRQKKYQKSLFSFQQVRFLQERLIAHLENHGYPFATVRLDSILIEQQKIEAQFFLQKGKLIRFDGIALEDDSVKISTRYLENYLGISPKTVYEQQKVKNIKARMNELPFLTLVGEPYLSFSGDRAKVKMLLQKNKASRFDAVLGLLPSNTSGGEERSFAVSGTLNLDLQNSLGKGERIFIDFQRLRAETQELKAQLTYPYILNYNIGIDASLNIYKSDNSFTDTRLNTGLQYLFSGNNYIKMYWSKTTTNLGKLDSLDIIQSKRLPEQLDVDVNAYGLEIVKQHLDYRYNPRKGWAFQIKSDVGTRVIQKNNSIITLKDTLRPDFNFASLYDSVTLRSLRLQGGLVFDVYVPLFQQSALKITTQAAAVFSQKPIYQNEQYRIGGNRILRGFDEASVYATKYAMLTLEYRFLFGQNSYFNVFSDAAYIENKTARQNNIQRPISVGAGMTFETRAGLFSIVYALGKPSKSSFEFRNGKIHFGYVNLF